MDGNDQILVDDDDNGYDQIMVYDDDSDVNDYHLNDDIIISPQHSISY